MAAQAVYNVTTDGDIADGLGEVRAQIKKLQDQQAFLEGLLKAKGVTLAEGDAFRVSISYGVETSRVDWKSVAEKLKPSRQLLTAHTSTSSSDRVRVTAMKKG
jgi:hypothetical protein